MVKTYACVILSLQGTYTLTPRKSQKHRPYIESKVWRLAPKGTFSQHGRRLLKINTLSPLSWLHGMHVSCILKEYHCYNSWYVTTLLLKSYFLFFLQISYILGLFSMTLILHANFIIFQTHLKHINPQTNYQTKQNINWDITMVIKVGILNC